MKPFFTLLALAAAVHAQPKADFYVSPSGNDKWSGKISGPTRSLRDGPFRTLARARDAVRELPSAKRRASPCGSPSSAGGTS